MVLTDGDADAVANCTHNLQLNGIEPVLHNLHFNGIEPALPAAARQDVWHVQEREQSGQDCSHVQPRLGGWHLQERGQSDQHGCRLEDRPADWQAMEGQFSSETIDGQSPSEAVGGWSSREAHVLQRDWEDARDWPESEVILGADLLYDPGGYLYGFTLLGCRPSVSLPPPSWLTAASDGAWL